MVGDERTARAKVLRTRCQHEVVDGELAAAVEQTAERAFALWTFEDIVRLDPDPGQIPPLGAQRVEFVGTGALLDEKRLAGGEPAIPQHGAGSSPIP